MAIGVADPLKPSQTHNSSAASPGWRPGRAQRWDSAVAAGRLRISASRPWWDLHSPGGSPSRARSSVNAVPIPPPVGFPSPSLLPFVLLKRCPGFFPKPSSRASPPTRSRFQLLSLPGELHRPPFYYYYHYFSFLSFLLLGFAFFESSHVAGEGPGPSVRAPCSRAALRPLEAWRGRCCGRAGRRAGRKLLSSGVERGG